MVDVDGSRHSFPADAQSKSVGLVWGLAATSAQWLCHDDSTINISLVIIIIIIIIMYY